MEYINLKKRGKDIMGQRFGRLVALGPINRTPRGEIMWLCQCDCGKTTNVRRNHLTTGNTQSCGCLKTDILITRLTTHGKGRNILYKLWSRIKQRCTNPNHPRYADWGGRGIGADNKWLDDFGAFYDHIITLPNFGRDSYTLDRIDNNDGYFPGNVRWASKTQQSRNSRHIHLLSHNGKTRCLTEWAEEVGINAKSLTTRLRAGWSVEKALTTPVRKQTRKEEA